MKQLLLCLLLFSTCAQPAERMQPVAMHLWRYAQHAPRCANINSMATRFPEPEPASQFSGFGDDDDKLKKLLWHERLRNLILADLSKKENKN